MKKSLFIFGASALLPLFVSCEQKAETPTIPTAVAESGTKPYPLDTCVVSGKKLGSMGDPVVLVHEGQEIKFCCDHCTPKFKQAPAKYLSKLEHASSGESHERYQH